MTHMCPPTDLNNLILPLLLGMYNISYFAVYVNDILHTIGMAQINYYVIDLFEDVYEI